MTRDTKQIKIQPAVDFGKAAADYGRWRQGFPAEFFARLKTHGIGLPGQRVLDLGTGTGLLARAFAQAGCRVTGLDLSAELIAEAKAADRAVKVEIGYVQAPAEASGLAAGQFDVVSAATCWHWFDRPRAAAEARRLLRPEGRLVIAALDWHPIPGNAVHFSIETIRRFTGAPAPSSRNSFQYPVWTQDLSDAGFHSWEVFAFTAQIPYSHEAWLGRIRASAAVGPAMDKATLARFDGELGQVLKENFPGETLAVDHMIFALIAWGRDGGE